MNSPKEPQNNDGECWAFVCLSLSSADYTHIAMTPSISRLASFTPILWRFLKEPVAHNAYPSIRVLLLHRSMWAALFAHALQNRRSSVLIPFSSFSSASATAAVTHPPLPPPHCLHLQSILPHSTPLHSSLGSFGFLSSPLSALCLWAAAHATNIISRAYFFLVSFHWASVLFCSLCDCDATLLLRPTSR